MQPHERHQLLEQLLRNESFADQTTLASRLSELSGQVVTQTMISRDLKAIGAVKRLDGSYGKTQSDVRRALLKDAVLSIQHNGAIICIGCVGATAPLIGAVLDEEVPSLLGCISGENMVFATPKHLGEMERAVQEIQEIFYGKE